MVKGQIHIGTSGWSYKHWKGAFYPGDLAATGYLSYYAQQFSVAEINTSFYRLPNPETLQRWMQQVTPNFYFCPKISRYITHVKKLNDPALTLPRFFEVFEPFKERLGPILLQLPATVAYRAEKSQKFFEALHTYQGFKYALEVRHDSWFQPESIALLKQYQIALVLASSGKRWPAAEIITAPHIYLRFHGPDGSYGSDYDSDSLGYYAKKCIDWRQSGHSVWAFFNNDIHGYATKNALSLLEMIL